MLLKFYFRARNEVYTREHIENYHSHHKKKFKKSFKQTQKKSKNADKSNINECAINLNRLSGEAQTQIDTTRTSHELLDTLKLLNKCLANQLDESEFENLTNQKDASYYQSEKTLYYEEWKQASLVMDR